MEGGSLADAEDGVAGEGHQLGGDEVPAEVRAQGVGQVVQELGLLVVFWGLDGGWWAGLGGLPGRAGAWPGGMVVVVRRVGGSGCRGWWVFFGRGGGGG